MKVVTTTDTGDVIEDVALADMPRWAVAEMARIGNPEARAFLQSEAKYSPDQPRDDHGRFAGSGGDADPITPFPFADDGLNRVLNPEYDAHLKPIEAQVQAALPSAFVDLEGVPVALARDVAASVSDFAAEFPLIANRVQSVQTLPLDDETFAQVVDAGRGIELNKNWFGDEDSLREAMQESEEAGWHPPGTNSVRGLIDHELGHVLDFVSAGIGQLTPTRYNRLGDITTVSRYAATGGAGQIPTQLNDGSRFYPAEAFAEAYALREAKGIEALPPGAREAVRDVITQAGGDGTKAEPMHGSTCRGYVPPEVVAKHRPKREAKYSPDQPRDEAGRFAEGGAGDDGGVASVSARGVNWAGSRIPSLSEEAFMAKMGIDRTKVTEKGRKAIAEMHAAQDNTWGRRYDATVNGVSLHVEIPNYDRDRGASHFAGVEGPKIPWYPNVDRAVPAILDRLTDLAQHNPPSDLSDVRVRVTDFGDKGKEGGVDGTTFREAGMVEINDRFLGEDFYETEGGRGGHPGSLQGARQYDNVLVHEWGHILDDRTDDQILADAQHHYDVVAPSRYALEGLRDGGANSREYYAEAFADWYIGDRSRVTSGSERMAKEYEWKR